jgi:hypothetical protein
MMWQILIFALPPQINSPQIKPLNINGVNKTHMNKTDMNYIQDKYYKTKMKYYTNRKPQKKYKMY